jgi:class 3 adenylate cyclase
VHEGREGGGDVEVFGRLGVRVLPAPEMRRTIRDAGVVYVVACGGMLALGVSARDAVAHPGPYVAAGIGCGVVGLVLLAMGGLSPEDALPTVYARIAVAVAFGGTVVVPVCMYLGGLEVTHIGASTYVLLVAYQGWLLRRALAALAVALTLAGYATLLAVTGVQVAPVAVALFLGGVLVESAILIGGLVDALDRSVREEARLRAELARVNASLEARVAAQVDELDRLGRLRRFLAPQVADAVVSRGAESVLGPHRREIAVLFCDLRGFTAFAGQVEPEEVMDVLAGYYDRVGAVLQQVGATVGPLSGDGIMAWLNDPVPCEHPAATAVDLALRLCDVLDDVRSGWRAQGYALGYGIGVAMGHATLGVAGLASRSEYTPIGTVVNRAARLCDLAADGQVLVDQRTKVDVGERHQVRELPPTALKGFAGPLAVYEVLRTSTAVEPRPLVPAPPA